jgi:uncharacterized protein (DUF1697 family)
MKYCSILRGINVSGKNSIKMDTLRDLLKTIGFQNIKTYIQSGNVYFESTLLSTDELALRISNELKSSLNLTVPVLVLKQEELDEIISSNPFLSFVNFEPKFMHLTFLTNEIDLSGIPEIEEKSSENELLFFGNKVVYLYLPNGNGTTKLSNTLIEKKLKNTATTRNWNTCLELQKMMN